MGSGVSSEGRVYDFAGSAVNVGIRYVPQMKLRRLGTSDLRISPLGLGCWQFSEGQGLGGAYWEALPVATVEHIVQAWLDAGMNWFDTAEAYGDGRSEQMLSAALRACGQKNGDVVVATKWAPLPMRTARSIIKTANYRLKNLRGFHIDLHQIHMPVGALATHRQQMFAMAELVRQNKIKTVGISNFTARMMRNCHRYLAEKEVPLVSNQMEYSLLNRRIESNGVLDAAKDLGVTVIAYSPLAQGLLSGKFHDDPDLIKGRRGVRQYRRAFWPRSMAKSRPLIETLRRIGANYEATAAQVALNWLVSFHGDTVVAIPGATRLAHAESNVGALAFELSRAELDEIDLASRRWR